MGVAHQFCLSHQICCPIPATIKNCFTSLKGLCGVLFVLVLWWLYSRTTDAQWSLFSLKFQTFRLGQTIWADNFWGNWGIFGQLISTHFCFPLINHYLYKKLGLYIKIPIIYLGLGFKYGPRVSVVCALAPWSVSSNNA